MAHHAKGDDATSTWESTTISAGRSGEFLAHRSYQLQQDTKRCWHVASTATAIDATIQYVLQLRRIWVYLYTIIRWHHHAVVRGILQVPKRGRGKLLL